MQHLTLKATTTTVDQELGHFTALASAWTADRERDVIARDGFNDTIAAWQRSGKSMPLLFEHSSTVAGAIDPASMRADDQGLVVGGQVDRSTAEGRQVWRTIKAGTAGFSIGFMAQSRPRADGGRELYDIDLLEISATSKPMHPATRALAWKSAANGRRDVDMIWIVGPDGEPALVPADAPLPWEDGPERKAVPLPIRVARFEC